MHTRRSLADPELIRSVARPVRTEIEKIKGSRFIADVSPISSQGEMWAFLESVRDPAASHHCWAFRLGEGEQRSSDDGEPGGTAGPPILARIVGGELYNLGVIVTRHYGGTNLGTGGLIRAYGAAASAGISASTIVETVVMQSVTFRYTYDLSTAVATVLAGHGAAVTNAAYTSEVQITADVPRSSMEDFRSALIEATAGRISI